MIKPWIQSARLRTLPLAIAGILLGSAISKLHGHANWQISSLALITAILLQILSNFANDYGDFKKGTDSIAGRTDRMLTTGSISENAMKIALFILSGIVFLGGLFMIYLSFQYKLINQNNIYFFIGLGILSIVSAITYTIGKKAYAYLGLGDIFVFVFFGLAPVLGISKLLGCELNINFGLAAIGMGMLSMAVLNTNNYRDIESDKLSNKITIAVRLGIKWTLFYHRILLILGFSTIFFSMLNYINEIFKLSETNTSLEIFMVFGIFSPAAILLSSHFTDLRRLEPGNREMINPQLKKLSLTILLLILIYCSFVWYLLNIIGLPKK